MSIRHTAAAPGGRVPVVEVVITDRLDVAALPRLCALLDEALQLHPAQLVIDVAGCPYADAAAIGLLLEVHRRTRREGGLLTLRSPSARLRRNLRLARVDDVLHITAATPPQAPPGESGDDGSDVPTGQRLDRPDRMIDQE